MEVISRLRYASSFESAGSSSAAVDLQLPAELPRRKNLFRHQKNWFAALRDTILFLSEHVERHRLASAFGKWRTQFTSLYGEIWDRPRLRRHGREIASSWGFSAQPSALIFALQTSYSLLARAIVVQYLLQQRGTRLTYSTAEFIHLLSDEAFYRREWGIRNFLPALWDEEIVERARTNRKQFESAFMPLVEYAGEIVSVISQTDWQNTLTHLYEAIVPRPIRHDLGEYFTPYWLAQKTIAASGFCGEHDKKVFDPGCGSGSFLLAAAEAKFERERNFSTAGLENILSSIIGCDLNPLCVLSARLNWLWWLATRFAHRQSEVELPVFQYDTVFNTPLGNTAPQVLSHHLPNGCDYLVGNPPWISWNALPSSYREKLEKELLPKYNLFDFRGLEARLGHSNDDYLSTFSFITIHQYLREGGICSFLIKQPLLMNVAGKTFRHFEVRHQADGVIPLRVVKVADLRGLKPFGVANETAILVMEKGVKTTYPVDYEIWSKRNGHVEIRLQRAQPADHADSTSPWVILTDELRATKFLEGNSPYEIRHGIKHDAAGILIVRLVEQRNGHLLIELAGGRSRNSAEPSLVEPDWIYPFLQPRHLKSWGIDDHGYFLMPQRKAGENNEAEIASDYPLTYSYLKRFEPQFAARRSKVFTNKPFYGLFGLGEYTHARYKVCWVGLGFQPTFVVAEQMNDPMLGAKPVIPDGTLYFIPCADRDEAHFVCALLNSDLVRTFLSARSGKSKRGLSQKIVEQLALPLFNRGDARHEYLSKVSMNMHEAFRNEAKISLPNDFEKVVREVFQTNRVANSQN